jgi:hypothetical protein
MIRPVVGLILVSPLLLLAQTVPTSPTDFPAMPPTAVIAWQPVTKDVKGGTETIIAYEAAITAATVDLSQPGAVPLARKTLPATVTEIRVNDLLPALPDGNYRIWARAQDAAGTWSAWSVPFEKPVDGTAPAAPVLSIKIEVTVTVR